MRVCILNHFIPSGRIVEDVVSLFRPRIELSGLQHTRPCGPPTRPSETSGCILLLCKLQPSLGTNSSGLQPDSCNYKGTQSSFVQYVKLNLTKQSMNACYICDCNWIYSGTKWEHFSSFSWPNHKFQSLTKKKNSFTYSQQFYPFTNSVTTLPWLNS